MSVDRARRAAVVLLTSVLLAPASALAQDPRAAMVQRAAREWLLLADNLDGAATWKAAGPRFQNAITVAAWSEGLKRQRGWRGAVVQRAVAATTFGSSFKGLPPGGDYAFVQFRTSFAQKVGGGEHVTLERGADSIWRVIGYVII